MFHYIFGEKYALTLSVHGRLY